jgi:PAS domain S-box-containing protein
MTQPDDNLAIQTPAGHRQPATGSTCPDEQHQTGTTPHASGQRVNILPFAMFEGIVISEGGCIAECNAQFACLVGYAHPLELAGMPITALIAPEHRNHVLGTLRQGHEAISESDLIRKDGSRISVEVHGKTFLEGDRAFRCSIFRDITKRRSVETALKVSHANLEHTIQERTAQLEKTIRALNSEVLERQAAQRQLRRLSRVFMDAKDPIIIEDLAGTIIDLNREAEKAYGWKRGELIGKSIRTILPGELWDEADRLRQRCRNGEEIHQVEWVRLSKSGERNSLLVTVFPLVDETGVSTEIASIAKDITVRKRMESALRKSRHDLLELSRKSIAALEADRQVVARELHDSVGGSLAAIKFIMEEIRAKLPDEQAATRNLVHKTIDHLAETIKETKRISVQLRPLSLDDLGLLATIAWYTRQFSEQHPGITLQQRFDVSENEISDAHKIVIYRILQEALTNAVKHSGANTIRIELCGKGPYLLFEVEDNGCGFDPQAVLEGGDPLNGYGLQSMRERAELCSATFVLDSYPGQGTLIRTMLPRDP